MASSTMYSSAATGIDLGLKMGEAFQQQYAAQAASFNLQRQMDEIDWRTDAAIQDIYKTSEKVQSNQVAAFIKGGVEISGSALSVLSDTISDAASAAYIRQRESDYDKLGLAISKAGYDRMASNEALLLNMGSTAIGGISKAATAKYGNNKADVRNRGAAGLGETNLPVDRAGGTTGYSRDYLASK